MEQIKRLDEMGWKGGCGFLFRGAHFYSKTWKKIQTCLTFSLKGASRRASTSSSSPILVSILKYPVLTKETLLQNIRPEIMVEKQDIKLLSYR